MVKPGNVTICGCHLKSCASPLIRCVRRLSPSHRFRWRYSLLSSRALTWGNRQHRLCAMTGIPAIHADSDLDSLIRAPQPISLRRVYRPAVAVEWVRCAGLIPVWIHQRADSVLAEWLR